MLLSRSLFEHLRRFLCFFPPGLPAPEELIQRADAEMYRAKQGIRDKDHDSEG
jgi:hypothetical protein